MITSAVANNAAISAATTSNDGQLASSSAVIPCTACAPGWIETEGLIRQTWLGAFSASPHCTHSSIT